MKYLGEIKNNEDVTTKEYVDNFKNDFNQFSQWLTGEFLPLKEKSDKMLSAIETLGSKNWQLMDINLIKLFVFNRYVAVLRVFSTINKSIDVLDKSFFAEDIINNNPALYKDLILRGIIESRDMIRYVDMSEIKYEKNNSSLLKATIEKLDKQSFMYVETSQFSYYAQGSFNIFSFPLEIYKDLKAIKENPYIQRFLDFSELTSSSSLAEISNVLSKNEGNIIFALQNTEFHKIIVKGMGDIGCSKKAYEIVSKSPKFKKIFMSHDDTVARLNSNLAKHNIIVFYSLGVYSSSNVGSTSIYTVLKDKFENEIARGTIYRPTSLGNGQNVNAMSFGYSTLAEVGDGYAAIEVYEYIG